MEILMLRIDEYFILLSAFYMVHAFYFIFNLLVCLDVIVRFL